MERTDSYHFTVDNDPAGHVKISALRGEIKTFNAFRKRVGLHGRFRVMLHGRLGKNSPYGHLYRRGGAHWVDAVNGNIRLEHASRIDVYVNRRY